ncbi:M20/M25/M40 family metallo-hydrolase [candidate division KSB1 bacterium]|nr:M20/M25/M40 family metallo-hydrolase [candidate division KSB1 bacterium]
MSHHTKDRERMYRLFVDLAGIDAVSLHEKPIADHLTDWFSRRGLTVEMDDAGQKCGSDCGNLLVRIPGTDEPLMLVAHLDTVAPTAGLQPILEDDIIRSDGQTILGADNRAGVAVILYAVEQLLAHKRPHRSLELVFTIAEELGMLGALALDFSSLQAREAYIFDCSREIGSYVFQTPTAIDFDIDFYGKAAHSGVNPERGINALSMALPVLQAIPVGRVDAKTVANIGTIRGGQAINVVPDQVEVTGEMRSFDSTTLEKLTQSIQDSCLQAAQKHNGRIEPHFKVGFQGFTLSQDNPVVERLLRVLERLEISGNPLVYYGGSDANVFNANGIQALNIGIGASNPHSTDEQIALSDLLSGAQIIQYLTEVDR